MINIAKQHIYFKNKKQNKIAIGSPHFQLLPCIRLYAQNIKKFKWTCEYCTILEYKISFVFVFLFFFVRQKNLICFQFTYNGLYRVIIQRIRFFFICFSFRSLICNICEKKLLYTKIDFQMIFPTIDKLSKIAYCFCTNFPAVPFRKKPLCLLNCMIWKIKKTDGQLRACELFN